MEGASGHDDLDRFADTLAKDRATDRRLVRYSSEPWACLGRSDDRVSLSFAVVVDKHHLRSDADGFMGRVRTTFDQDSVGDQPFNRHDSALDESLLVF